MIKVVREKISRDELKSFLGNPYSDMIKFVVDIKKEIIALGGELHSDAESLLIEQGSVQSDLWGGNLFLEDSGKQRIEYSSMINIRPSAGNRALEVKDDKLKSQMKAVIDKLLL